MRLRLLLPAFALASALAAVGNDMLAQEELKYQKRAYRFEGIKPKPVSGFDVELLSARVDHQDDPDRIGDRLYARFYLDQPHSVNLVVRELDYKHYYWLDKVEPKTPWQAGFNNVFEWPTADVIQQLRDLKLYDLGVVARLDKANPSADETVAPVVLYQRQTPSQVKGYVFFFRLRDDAKVKAAFFEDAGTEALVRQDLGIQRGGRPFAVKWDASAASARAGRYKLVLSGYVLSTNDPISQVVRFHHQPSIR
jgi:hypothetical protein